MTVPDPIVLSVDRVSLTIDANDGGRATSWMIDGREVLAHCGIDPVEYGMYPMAPWAGRLRGNTLHTPRGAVTFPATHREWALHGTVLTDPCSIVGAPADALGNSVDLRAALRSPWPWAGECDLSWMLEMTGSDVTVRTRIEVRSADEESFPVVLGWHPWFRRRVPGASDLIWHLPAYSRLVRGADHLPTGALQSGETVGTGDGPFDDAFLVPARVATLRWPTWVDITVSNSHPWFVVFDEREEAVCVEPQTGPPNGVNPESPVDCDWVTPESPVVMETAWTISWLGDQPVD